MSSYVTSQAEERESIRSLILSYGSFIDEGDIDSVVALFAHASIISTDGTLYTGRTVLRRLWSDGLQLHEGSPRTRHLITNIEVQIDDSGVAATARSCVTVLQELPAFPLQVIVAGRHYDAFEKIQDVWRFRERRDIRDLTGDLRHHFRDA
jgi:hypothetical protein